MPRLLFLFLWLSLLSWSGNAQADKDVDGATGTIGAYFVHKSVIIPHDSKKNRGGEDAAATSEQFLVVADGVGGWARHNVNPGLYSRALAKHIVELGAANVSLPLTDIVHAANWLAAEKHLGSATCTTLKLTDPTTIQTLNVGDSGYSIHRRNENNEDGWDVVFASEPGQKRFNFPHQLGGQYGDEVNDVGVPKTHNLEPEDVIVVYSDGVSDNLFPKQFQGCFLALSASYSWVADCIARKAYALGKDKSFLSPFAKGAREAGWNPNYGGGKHDDITVIVAQVQKGNIPILVEDPYFEESIFLYTGPVEPTEDMVDPALLQKKLVHEEL